MPEETFEPRQTSPTSPPHHYYPETFPILKPRKSNLPKIIFGIIVIGLLGIGISLATRIWDPFWNPFRPDPEKVITRMTEKMQKVKTLHTDLNAELNIKNESEFNVNAKIWGDADNQDPQNLKSVAGLDINFTMEGMQFSLGVEAKQIGETSYLKLTTLPALPLLQLISQASGIDFNQLKDQWIKIDIESLKKLMGEELTPEKEEEMKKALEESKKQQEQMTEKLKKIIENKKLYLVKKELPDEKIREVNAYHYVVALNHEEIKKIIPELFKTMGETLGESDFTGISEARLRAKDARIIADMMQMRTTAEIIYSDNHSYSKLSCNYSDASSLCEDIAEYAGNKPVIFAGDQEYCAYTPLLVKGYYDCIDSGLNAVTININPQGTGYCNGKTFVCPSAAEISDEDFKKAAGEEFSKDLDKFFEKVGELSGELWIGKKDNFLYRFKGEKTIDLSSLIEGERGTILIKLNIDLSKFNQPVKIEAPGQYKNLEEILSPILGEYGKSLGKAQERAKDAMIIADLNQIRTVAEWIYTDKSSYERLCSEPPDTTLNEKDTTYGQDYLSIIEKNIEDQQGGTLDIICLDSTTSYCLTVDLSSSQGGRYCLDSSLVSEEIPDSDNCLGVGTVKNPFRCPEQEQLGFIQGATYTVLNYSGLDRDFDDIYLRLEVQPSEADNQLLFFYSGSQDADEVVALREGDNVIPLNRHAPRGIAEVSFKVEALHTATMELRWWIERKDVPLQFVINFYNPKEYNSVIYLDRTTTLTSTRLELKNKEVELEIEFQDYLGRTLDHQEGIARQGQFVISSFMSKEAALESGGATARTMILSSDFPLDFSLVSPGN